MIQNRWNENEAEKNGFDPLGMRVYTSRLIGADSRLVLHGGGNTSVKIEDVLYVKGSGWDLVSIEKPGFAPVKLKMLQGMAELPRLSDSDMVAQQRTAMTNPAAPNPSVEAILHAIIPFAFVDHTHADAVVTLSNTPDGEENIRKAYGDRVFIVPYVMPGFILAKTIYEMAQNLDWDRYEGIVLLNHGIFTYSNSAKESYDKMIELVNVAESYLDAKAPLVLPELHADIEDSLVQELCEQVSELRGTEVVPQVNASPLATAFSRLENVDTVMTYGPLTPEHVIRTKPLPLIVEDDAKSALDNYVSSYRAYFDQYDDGTKTMLDTAPRYAVIKGKGSIAFGKNEKEAAIITDINNHTFEAVLRAQKLGGWKSLERFRVYEMEYWELEQAKLKK